MIQKKKTSIALTSLTLSAAVGLAFIPTDSEAQRRGDYDNNSRGKFSNYSPTRVAPPVYQNNNRRDFGHGHNHGPVRGGMEVRIEQNAKLLDDLADQMVWRARYEMVRERSPRASSAYRVVSNHAKLTDDLVKAAHGTCPIALRKAAVAVHDNIDLMSDRRTRFVQASSHGHGGRTCGTVNDPLLSLINESKAPACFIVDNVNRWNTGGRAYVNNTPHRPVPTRGRTVEINKTIKPGDIFAAILRKHFD